MYEKDYFITTPISGTATHHDNTSHEVVDDSIATIDVNQEAGNTFAEKKAMITPITFSLSDVKKSVKISYRILNSLSGKITRVWSNFTKDGEKFSLAFWTTSECGEISLGELNTGVLKENKYGRLADIGTIIQVCIFEISKINCNYDFQDDKMRKILNKAKNGICSRKNRIYQKINHCDWF